MQGVYVFNFQVILSNKFLEVKLLVPKFCPLYILITWVKLPLEDLD